MSDFPTWLHLPIGRLADTFVHWLMTTQAHFFDGVTAAVLYILLRVERFFVWLPWWLVIIAVAALAWRVARRWQAALGIGCLLLLIGSFGYWQLAMMTLAIVGISTLLALLIGIPTGILMARSNVAKAIIRPILDAMQTLPSFVYLIPAMMLLGLGKVPAVFATTIYAVAPVIRLTDLGIRQVDAEVIEASAAFGATRWQALIGVQLPLALPSIMTGINQTTMMALSMVVIASMIGARGLGEQVLLGIQRMEVGRGLEAGLAIVALAIVIDRLTQGAAAKAADRG